MNTIAPIMVLVRFNPAYLEEIVDSKIEEIIEIPWKLGGEARLENGEFIAEFNPDRPDLYSFWGLSRAIRLYMNKESYRETKVLNSSYYLENKNPKNRPYIVSAVVKNSEAGKNLQYLIDFQEKLHSTLGRNRRIAAIGIHDLNMVKFPLTYTEVPRNYEFTPLGETQAISLKEFMQTNDKAKEYGNLVGENITAILDIEGNIISLPPILNSNITALKDGVKDFFIDVTGTDLSTVQKVLNLLIGSLSYPTGEVYEVNVSGIKYPILTKESWKIDEKKVKEISGMEIPYEEIERSLLKMGYEVKNKIAYAPEYRIDIFGEIDFIEDVLKGYGYENLKESKEDFTTIGKGHELRDIQYKLRELMVGYGYVETSNFALINGSYNRIFGFSNEYIKILNPVTLEQDVIRPRISISLIQSLLNNTRNPYPQRIFEIGTVLRNGIQYESLGIASCHRQASFSEIKGIFIGLLEDLGLEYEMDKFEHELFIDGRAAKILIKGKQVGFFGEVHPKILKQIGLKMPLAIGEIDITGGII